MYQFVRRKQITIVIITSRLVNINQTIWDGTRSYEEA